MHVVAVLRLTPDLTEELDIAESGLDIDREWIGLKLNEFDDHALEEAVLLKESAGATVTALAIDGEGAERMLRSAIARGADEAVKIPVSADTPLDSRASAPVIASAIRELGADVVFTGVQTPDDVFGPLAPYLGAILGWPQVSAVNGLSVAEGKLRVQQEYSGGRAAVFEVDLPAVIGIQTASQPPRYVSGSKLRQAMASGELRSIPAGSAPAANAAVIVRLAKPERAAGAEMINGGADAVADRVHEILVAEGLCEA